ncbi:hypothetical protein QFC24_000465 [Naganishia onofrii]|uniref:Uncharacterized protein n=1 Tax=Naganishia onofrii TaxID=1851511 RepID=A0ACC2XW89_9TREE|nr:hypothetical protein QFC24_000465 [Naganishia onofrii]
MVQAVSRLYDGFETVSGNTHRSFAHGKDIHPEAFEEYLAPVPENERDDMVKAYHKLLNSDNDEIRVNAAKAWSKWE